MRVTIPRRFKLKNQRGQSLMEFALVLPVLLLLMMAIFDFGRMLFIYSQLSNGAREGARTGSLTGIGTHSPTNPQYLDCTAIRNAVMATMGLSMALAPSDILIQYDNGANIKPGPGGTLECEDRPVVDDILVGDRIRVTVRSTFTFVTPGMREIIPPLNFSFSSARTILKGGTEVPINSR